MNATHGKTDELDEKAIALAMSLVERSSERERWQKISVLNMDIFKGVIVEDEDEKQASVSILLGIPVYIDKTLKPNEMKIKTDRREILYRI